jgi:hypothetical protein
MSRVEWADVGRPNTIRGVSLRSARRPRSARTAAAAIVIAAACGGTLLAGLVVERFDPDTACCDHLFYRSMSYNLFSVTRPDLDAIPAGNELSDLYGVPDYGWLDHRNGLARQPPYVYRVVTPLLARAIAPITGIDDAYWLISLLALAGAATFLGLTALRLTGSAVPAVVVVAAFLTDPPTARWNLNDFMLTDPMAFFLTALAIWALVERRRVLFFVVCAIGVLNKESMVPLLLAYPLTEGIRARRFPWVSASWAVAIGMGWFVFRIVLPVPVDTYSILGQFREGSQHVRLMGVVLLFTMGPLLPAVRRGLRDPVVLGLLPFAAAAVLSAWFVDDLERAMIQALPVALIAGLRPWTDSLRARIAVLVPAALLLGQNLAGLAELLNRKKMAAIFLVALAAEVVIWTRGWLEGGDPDDGRVEAELATS